MDLNLFKEYPSNTVASSSNNLILLYPEETQVTGRIFLKVRDAGRFDYRFFFCNTEDSTFDNGSTGYANRPGSELKVISAFAGECKTSPEEYNGRGMIQLTFNGDNTYTAQPDEFWATDPVSLEIAKDSYIVFQWTVKGKDIPYTPDKLYPSYRLVDGKWESRTDIPQPILIGAKRETSHLMVFLGDSITMGLGTDTNKYNHWVSYISKGLDHDIAVWNIGLGFGRAQDAATNGAWLKKAAAGDIVNICFGVNDILQGRTTELIKKDLETTVRTLHANGCKIGLFTIPPFDYNEHQTIMWRDCCYFIKNKLSKYAEYVFDTSIFWGQMAPNDNLSRFGGHPSPEGCQYLADGFLRSINISKILTKEALKPATTKKIDRRNTKMVAHRGLSGIETENTLPAFVAAGNRSFFGIETDVHKTKDGKYVILHDSNPERVSGVSMNVCEENFDDIRKVELRDRTEDQLSRIDLRIPTLREYVTICKRYGKRCVLELKDNFDEESLLEIADIIKSLDYFDETIIISFHLGALLRFRKLFPDHEIMYLCGEVNEDLWQKLIENHFGIDTCCATLEMIERAHANGLLVNAWTIDSATDAQRLADWGIDFITTDIVE